MVCEVCGEQSDNDGLLCADCFDAGQNTAEAFSGVHVNKQAVVLFP